METKKISALLMVSVVVSFIGFIVENVWIAFSKGYMNNRNMCLPFLFGYGMAMILLYLILGLPQSPKFLGKDLHFKNKLFGYLYYFCLTMIFISVGEILLGTIVESICGYQWWNYNWIPLHITQYTSIPTSIGFSTIVFIVMKYVFEFLYEFFLSLDSHILIPMSIFFVSILFIDMIYNLSLMLKSGKAILRWKIIFK